MCLSQILFSSMYVSMVYFLSSQPPELFRFSMFLGVCFLVSLVAQSAGLFIGASLAVEVTSDIRSNLSSLKAKSVRNVLACLVEVIFPSVTLTQFNCLFYMPKV